MFQVNVRSDDGFSDPFTISTLLAFAVRCAGYGAIGGLVDERFIGKEKVRFYYRHRRQAKRFSKEVNRRLGNNIYAGVLKGGK